MNLKKYQQNFSKSKAHRRLKGKKKKRALAIHGTRVLKRKKGQIRAEEMYLNKNWSIMFHVIPKHYTV